MKREMGDWYSRFGLTQYWRNANDIYKSESLNAAYSHTDCYNITDQTCDMRRKERLELFN